MPPLLQGCLFRNSPGLQRPADYRVEQNSAAPDFGRPEEGLLWVMWQPVIKIPYLTDLLDLSLEFLMGRALDNSMLNVDMKDAARGR